MVEPLLRCFPNKSHQSRKQWLECGIVTVCHLAERHCTGTEIAHGPLVVTWCYWHHNRPGCSNLPWPAALLACSLTRPPTHSTNNAIQRHKARKKHLSLEYTTFQAHKYFPSILTFRLHWRKTFTALHWCGEGEEAKRLNKSCRSLSPSLTLTSIYWPHPFRCMFRALCTAFWKQICHCLPLNWKEPSHSDTGTKYYNISNQVWGRPISRFIFLLVTFV